MRVTGWLRATAVACGLALLTLCLPGLLPAAPTTIKRLRVEAKQIVSQKMDGKIRQTTLATARVLHEDTTFAAQTILMRSEGDVHEFTCTGSPLFTDPENRITAEKVLAYSTPRRAEFHENVKMVSTPAKKTTGDTSETRAKVTGKPSTTTCDRLTYDYATKHGVATGHVVVVQEERTLWADEGIYDQRAELITLKGNVRLRNSGEDELKELTNADTVTISLENDWIDIVAREGQLVELVLDVKDADEHPAPPVPAPGKPAPKSGR
jgi:lipopolysaccharide export system protein LptA